MSENDAGIHPQRLRVEPGRAPCNAFILDEGNLTIAEVHGDSRAHAVEVAHALAAAPTMHAALEEALGLCEDPDDERQMRTAAIIQAALRLYSGETQTVDG